jgi:hypothetical protein
LLSYSELNHEGQATVFIEYVMSGGRCVQCGLKLHTVAMWWAHLDQDHPGGVQRQKVLAALMA